MSRYKGELYTFESSIADDRKVDEVLVLRGAVDHLSHWMAELAIERSGFDASYPLGDLAATIYDMLDMIQYREAKRRAEPDSKAAQPQA